MAVGNITREADDLLRIWSEMDRQVAHHGFRGIGDLLGVQQQVQAAANHLVKEEIDAGLLRVHGILGSLRSVRRQIGDLLEIKEKLPQVGDI